MGTTKREKTVCVRFLMAFKEARGESRAPRSTRSAEKRQNIQEGAALHGRYHHPLLRSIPAQPVIISYFHSCRCRSLVVLVLRHIPDPVPLSRAHSTNRSIPGFLYLMIPLRSHYVALCSHSPSAVLCFLPPQALILPH